MSKLNKQIIFWGTPQFAVPSLDSLYKLGILAAVVTQPNRPAGRGKKILASPVKSYALENDITILEPDSLDTNFEVAIKKYLPATFVIVAYGKIIPQRILDLSELPAINIHPSLLPVLRGPSPIQTAVLSSFKSTGVSLMQLDKKMDHGPILSQIKAKIGSEEDYLGLSERLSQLGADLLAQNIGAYLSGQLTPLAQDDSQATYCHLIKKEDGQIDFKKTAQQIHNQVRAYNKWPGAQATLDDLELKILETKISKIDLKPGQSSFDQKNIFVGTSLGSIQILKLQPAGKKIMLAEEFIRGYQKYLNKNFILKTLS